MVVTVRERTPEDQTEVEWRVRVYTRQVEQYGHIMWLANVMKPPSTPQDDETPTKEDD